MGHTISTFTILRSLDTPSGRNTFRAETSFSQPSPRGRCGDASAVPSPATSPWSTIELRRENIPLLRSLKTPVTFTPSGGFHVWLRTKEPKPQPEVIMRVTRLIPFEMDLVRGDGGQVVVPPSKLKDVGNYWFMDDSKIRREGRLGIRAA